MSEDWLPAPDHDGYWWLKEVYRANGEIRMQVPVMICGTEGDEIVVYFIGACPRKFPQDFAYLDCVKFLSIEEPS